MNTNKKILVLLVIFIIATVVLGWQFLVLRQENARLRQSQMTVQFDAKILSFEKIFIEKVLKADKEIDFETRLQLENAVRDLNDNEILSAWQAFTHSPDEIEAQKNVKELLSILVNKVSLR